LKEENGILRIISNEAKSSIDQISVVTPTVYASIFSQFAKEHNHPIDDDTTIAQEIMQLECSNLTSMQQEASKSATLLSNNTEKAITAIKSQDKASLEKVLKETQALRDELEKLKEAVYKDELTNVFNRKWVQKSYLQDDAESFKEAGTLVMIDLNYFKQVNDTYGHVIGDKVLIFIATALKKSRQDIIRYGGDEFIVIFHKNVSLESALKTLHDIRENILTKKLKSGTNTFRVSFSFGGTTFKENDTLAETIALADKNMYEDKIKIKKRVTGI